MITVVELPEFIRRSKKLLNKTERERIVYYLAANPASGVIIEGTGGIRKLRWKREGSGKSGGVRVIYYLSLSNTFINNFLTLRDTKDSQSTLELSDSD